MPVCGASRCGAWTATRAVACKRCWERGIGGEVAVEVEVQARFDGKARWFGEVAQLTGANKRTMAWGR